MPNPELTKSLHRVAAITGVGDTDYIKDHETCKAGIKPHDAYGYAAIAFNRAVEDAGIDKSEIDGLVCSPFHALERAGEVLGINPSWGEVNDPMSGIMSAAAAINSGLCEVVAFIGGCDQRSAAFNYGGANAAGGAAFLSYIYHSPWGFTSQGALYGLMMQRFMHETGFTHDDLGQVAVGQRLHASLNEKALMRKRITIEDYHNSRFVCEPLHLFDYCLINDGGVAYIMMSAERAAKSKRKPVYIEGIGRHDLSSNSTSLEPRLTEFYRPAQKIAGSQSFNMANLGPEDMSALAVYDSFSPHIPLALEGYGYCGYGEAAKFIREKGISLERGLPINTSGGHLSESYQMGWNHHVEAVRQIRGECGARQVPNCNYVHFSSDVAGQARSIIYGH